MSTRRIGFWENFSLDNISEFVNKYIIQIVIFFIILGITIFAFIFVGQQQERRNEALTARFYRAMNLGDVEAKNTFEDIYNKKENNANIRALAGLRLAEILRHENDFSKLKVVYKNVFDFKKSDPFLRNLAGINLLNMMINQNNPSNFDEIENLIANMKKKDNPFKNILLEQEAMFEMQRNNKENASVLLNNLLQNDIDPDMRIRVQILLSLFE